VPQAKPKAGDDARPLVLPELPQGKGTVSPMNILFLHGWQSVPGGVKPTYLKDHGHTVINPKFPDDDMDEAVRIAQAEFDQHQPQIVVGSSRGGAVAMNIKSGAAKLVLLCPAWKKFGTVRTVKPGTLILHSRADDVIPFADSKELVRNSGLPAEALIEVGSDHRLADPEPLAAMLRECKGAT
jgi:pimeloyl-ACP methyl ester carboxylesterase